MLHLYINGLEAALPKDLELSLKLSNDWFNDRQKDHSYPFTLQLEPNRHIFGFPDRSSNVFLSKYQNLPEAPEYSADLPAVIMYGTITILTGYAKISSVTLTEIEIYCYTGDLNFWALCAAKLSTFKDYLSLYANGSSRADGDAVTAWFSYLDYDSAMVTFPQIYDPTMSTIPMQGADEHINKYVLNYRVDGSLVPAVDSNYVVFLPCVRLKYLFETLVSVLGYTIESSVLDSIPEFDNIYIVSRRRYISLYKYTSEDFTINLTDFLPDISVRELFEEIEKKFGVMIYASDYAQNADVKTCHLSVKRFPDGADSFAIDVMDSVDRSVIDDDDKVKGYKLSDTDPSDDAISELVECVEPIVLSDVLGEDYDDAKSVECLSSPMTNWFDDLESDTDTYKYRGLAYIKHGDTASYRKSSGDSIFAGLITDRAHEFRIGLLDPTKHTLRYRLNNDCCLLWEHLKQYYAAKFNFQKKQYDTIEFTINSPESQLPYIQRMFSSVVVVKNRRFMVTEQEIVFTSSGVEYKITCLPA